MIVNESFLDSATLRENVVSLARNIGYVPRSKTSAKAQVKITGTLEIGTSSVTLPAGLICVGSANNTSYVFSIPENITTTVKDNSFVFNNLDSAGKDKGIDIYQGSFFTKTFTVDWSLDQRFILNNSDIDTSTISVYVKGINDSGLGVKYSLVENILTIDSNSNIFLIQEVQDEKYELIFGDGKFGKKLEHNAIITVHYIITNGTDGNGCSQFSFQSILNSSSGSPVSIKEVNITTIQSSQNGSEIEPID